MYDNPLFWVFLFTLLWLAFSFVAFVLAIHKSRRDITVIEFLMMVVGGPLAFLLVLLFDKNPLRRKIRL